MLLVASIMLAATLVGVPAPGAMAIAFEENAVVARGLTPGASVVWFGIARERPRWTTRVVRRDAVVADGDGDGVVRLELKRAVALQSIWAVVDLATGAFAVATPEGMPRREVELPEDSLRPGLLGTVEAFQDARQFLEILVVRPGQGAWALSVGDGGASDADLQSDGSVQASLASMRPIQASSAAPDQLVPRDVIIVIDPRRMEFYAATFGKPR